MKQLSKRMRGDRIFVWAVVIPAMAMLTLTIFYPLLKNVYYMFQDFNYIKPPEFVGMANIQRFFHDEYVWNAFKNTFVITAFSVPLVISISLLLSVAVYNIRFCKNFIRSALFVPYLVPGVVSGIIFKLLFGTEIGFVNVFLQNLGFDKVPWLTTPSLAIACIVLINVWNNIGYYLIIFLAGLSSINTQIYEAARVDGAGRLRVFWSITVPQLKPSIVFAVIYATISFMRTFPVVQVLTEGGPYRSTETVVMYMFDTGFVSRDVGYASVIAVALILIMLMISLVQMKLTKYMND